MDIMLQIRSTLTNLLTAARQLWMLIAGILCFVIAVIGIFAAIITIRGDVAVISLSLLIAGIPLLLGHPHEKGTAL